MVLDFLTRNLSTAVEIVISILLVLVGPAILLMASNHLGFTDVEVFNFWNLVAALAIISVLGGFSLEID